MALTANQVRDLLIDYIDGPYSITKGLDPDSISYRQDAYRRRAAIYKLVERGLLAYDRKVSPTTAMLTIKGRHTVCAALADCADALTRAGWERGTGYLVPYAGAETRAEK